MKLTNKQLRKIIKEELEKVLKEDHPGYGGYDPYANEKKFARRDKEHRQELDAMYAKYDTEEAEYRKKKKEDEEALKRSNSYKATIKNKYYRKVRDRAIPYFENKINETYGLGRSDIEKLLSKEGGVVVPEGRFKNNELYDLEDIAVALIDKQLKDGLRLKDIKEDPKLIGNTIGIDMFELIDPIIRKNRTFLNKVGNFMFGGGYKE